MYCYASIERASREIRLVRFATVPDGFVGRRSCPELDMTTVSLDEQPSYHALSYLWGDPTPKFPIVVDGEDFEVAENLHFALGQLRRVTSSGKWFWIDAICINQNDVAEKSWQVGQMRDIFKAAEHVYISLADSEDGSQQLLEGFQSFGHEALKAGVLELWTTHHDPNLNNHQPTHELFPKVLDSIQLQNTQNIDAIRSLLVRSNWSRAWINQEIALAGSGHILCGEQFLDLDMFHAALTAIYLAKTSPFARRLPQWDDFGSDISNNAFHIPSLLSRQRHLRGQPANLLELLLSDKRGSMGERPFYMASDPRDIIFALLGFATDTDILGLRPDYSKPVEVIYAEATTAMMARDSAYELEYCSFPKDTPGLPSWVPDWQRIGRLGIEVPPLNYRNHFFASRGRTQPLPAETYSSTLKKRGIHVDTVDRVLMIKETGISEQDTHAGRMALQNALRSKASRTECLRSIVVFDNPCLKSPSSESILRRAMLAGLMGNETRTPEFESLSLRAFRQEAMTPSTIDESQLEWILRNSYPSTRPLGEGYDLQLLLDEVCDVLVLDAAAMARGRTLFATIQGTVGMGPHTMRSGDVLTILFGTQVPIVLRPAGNAYTYVGDAYLDGAMDVECLAESYEELTFYII
ncbi:heterokaryon incompatibility protein [Stachybotrys elegans]|uniref:Heterokaryon incompatibility protein n=1 Tax=Stachybotrys elegans TaxID=80388 RepID=A0A8K0SHS8_9HYPO|nr:heterokaryon incompatibility protein [Stachybotrys elegans]